MISRVHVCRFVVSASTFSNSCLLLRAYDRVEEAALIRSGMEADYEIIWFGSNEFYFLKKLKNGTNRFSREWSNHAKLHSFISFYSIFEKNCNVIGCLRFEIFILVSNERLKYTRFSFWE